MPPPDPELARWFAEEVLPHEAALRGWLAARFPSIGDVDDLVQEAYSRLLRVRETGSIACARAFLFVTARNLALNQIRHSRHTRPEGVAEIDPAIVLDESAVPPETLSRAEDLQLLIQAIQSLPDRCRQVVTLRKIFGLSQKETAARLDITENTVEVQSAIGLRKCIEFFRHRGYGRVSRP